MRNTLRNTLLIIVGMVYLALGLIGLAEPLIPGFFVVSKSYNLFLAFMGVLSLGAADLGGDEAKWFDFVFGLVLIGLTILGAWDFLYNGTTPLGHVFLNALMSILLLYVGLVLNHRLKHQRL